MVTVERKGPSAEDTDHPVGTVTTRADLIARAKRRAIRELMADPQGAGIVNAVAVLERDLAENRATASHPAVILAGAYLMAGGLRNVADARDFIDGVQ